MPNPGDPVAARLEADRLALLDLSLRNPLLSHRPRARGFEVVGESPEQVVRCLVRDGRRMTFLPASAVKDTDEKDALPAGQLFLEQPSQPRVSELSTISPPVIPDPADHKLQTSLNPEALQTRLLATFYAARASIEEQGVNTLFLALGMLRWIEPGHEGVLRAPLILVPVELERSSARERFRLRHAGGDLETNLSLSQKLRADFSIELPEAPEATEAEVTRYFDSIASNVKEQTGWEVDRAAIVLGFFSFGKFLMYRDLDRELWPESAQPAAHPVVRALLRDGFQNQDSVPVSTADDEAVALDQLAPPEASWHVVDADATQALALLDVANGRNLVIQGPPGTGKSQTITNLIAAAIGQGRSVLFVAEKLAALDVVKRRLDTAGLGNACLELHSHKTNKKAILAELDRTRRVGKPAVQAPEDDFALLASIRDRLNAYHAAVHAPVGVSGVSPFVAASVVIGPEIPLPTPIVLPAWSTWTPLERRRRLALVAELQASVATIGVPREHPFSGSKKTTWMPDDAGMLRERLTVAAESITCLSSASAALADFLRIPIPFDREGCGGLLRAAKRVTRGAEFDLTGPDIANTNWLSRRAALQEVIVAGSRLKETRTKYNEILLPEAWSETEALSEARQVLNVEGRRWWRYVSPSYHRARRTLARLCRSTAPKTLEEGLALADAVLEARRNRETLRDHEALAAKVFGSRWQGEKSEWDHLALMSKWSAKLHHDIRAHRIPQGLIAFLADPPTLTPLRPMVDSLKSALSRHHAAIKALVEQVEFKADKNASPMLARTFAAQGDIVRLWTDRAGDLPALAAFRRLAERCHAEGLETVVDLAEVWPDGSGGLIAAVERSGAERLLTEAFRDRPALSGFDASAHERAIRDFTDLDRLALRHNRARAARAHWERIPRSLGGGGQIGVLLREFEKKTRHLPVRQLMARAGNAVQAIKPVFLMSPLSVAAYLVPGGIEFDLVVFDEASQVKPVDALGAILRGKQTVVVGDSRQLPPSSFFDRLTGGDDFDSDEDAEEASSDVESILGLFLAAGAPERMLRWHYRSRHESLIAVSNRAFYDSRLVVFPSPDTARRETGLVLRHLPRTVYDRGNTRTNPGEAEAVALAVIEHARVQLERSPSERLSLGVAAFSLAQTGAILECLEALRREHPDCEPFFASGGPEPFFVKNLENVQGDERDVMFISIGYGRTRSGEVAMSFGPLNGEGGERRLNVLITRARVRCEVFTNLTAADIDLSRTRSRGVTALKMFLAYAETGKLDVQESVASHQSSIAEKAFGATILAALSASARIGRTGIGVEGVAPDLAVADLEIPGQDRLGLLFDSLAAQTGRPARDRDRLRPQVLEALGWRIHRAWSMDWARDPVGARKRLFDAMTKAEPIRAHEPSPIPVAVLSTELPTVAESPKGLPYQLAEVPGELDLATAPLKKLVQRLRAVVKIESPIHREEAFWRVAEGAGAKRLGSKAQAALEAALDQALKNGSLVVREGFLWLLEMDPADPPIRDRSQLSADSRRPEFVADEEFAAAVVKVVTNALGMPAAEIPSAVTRLLGFPRINDELRIRIDAAIPRLKQAGVLFERGGHLVVVEKD